MRKIIVLLLASFILSFAASNNTKNILVLHSYNKDIMWVQDIDKAIFETVKPFQNDYKMHLEYMDTKKVHNLEYLLQLKKLYKIKYKDIKIDLILSSDDNAFNFLRNYRDELFGNTPVVFNGLNDFKDNDLDGTTNYTGVLEKFDAKETMQIALKLFPDTKNIYVINDYLLSGRATRRIIEKQLDNFEQNVSYSKNITISKLRTKLKSLDDNTIILLGVYFKDKSGEYITYEQMVKYIAKHTDIPIFSLHKNNLQQTAVGGKVVSGYQQGLHQSFMALKILNGIPTKDIPILKERATKFIFDYNILKKYNINIDLIPQESILLNKPISFYETHKNVILLSSFIIFILSVTIIVLLINIKKRKKVEKLLNDSQQKIMEINDNLEITIEDRTQELSEYKEALFIQTKAIILIIDPNSGKIVDCNNAALSFYQYSHDELTNKFIFEINQLSKEEIKEEMENAVTEKRTRFYFKHKIKDGIIKDVEVHTGPIVLDHKELLYSIIHDITEQREHELLMQEQSKLASMGEMIGNIAHQWRQPLSVISAGATGIKVSKEMDSLSDETLIKFCDAINDNAQYLSKTIDDFRDFIQGDREKVEFNLTQDINSFLHLIEGSIKRNNIILVKNIDDSIILEEYPNELIQCFINIFNNAKDALNNTDKEKYLFLTTFIENDQVIISFKDNANGIEKELLPHIFEPYFTTKHKSQGTGLGLSITYNLIVNGMNGTVSAHNKTYVHNNLEYKGAEFTISLPLR